MRSVLRVMQCEQNLDYYLDKPLVTHLLIESAQGRDSGRSNAYPVSSSAPGRRATAMTT